MLVTPSIVNSGNTTAPVENWNLGEVGKRGAGLLRLFGVLCPIFNAGELLVLEGLELEARDSLRRESLGYSSKFQPDGYFEVGVVAEDQLVVGGRAFLVGLMGETGWLAVFKRLRALPTKPKGNRGSLAWHIKSLIEKRVNYW
jgi:hypothetical protein